jgi:hypothetical protein
MNRHWMPVSAHYLHVIINVQDFCAVAALT